MKTKPVTVKISDLKRNLFVRQRLDQDRAFALALMIENGVTLPPIKINPDMVVIDGRHRIEAYELNERKEIEAEILPITDEVELIAEAYRCNVGGALPPNTQDTEQTVEMLLERGGTIKSVAEILSLPANIARHYVNNVRSRMARKKMLEASLSVTEGGLTVAAAAEKHHVDADKLKEFLSGKKKKQHGVAEMQRNLTKTFRSVGAKNARLCKSLLDKFSDGDVTEKQVCEILDHLDELTRQTARNVTDWRNRFESLTSKGNKAKQEMT